MRPQKRQSPPGRAGLAKRQTNGRGLPVDHSTAVDPVQRFLDRNEGVREVGNAHVMICPAHDDRRASLQVARGDDGRVLLHCFAGCSAADVVAAAGLQMADLFPRRLDTGHMSPAQRRSVTIETRTARRMAALNAVMPALALIEVAAGLVAAGETLAEADAERVRDAHQRIVTARQEVAR